MKKFAIFAAALCFVALAGCVKEPGGSAIKKGNVAITLLDGSGSATRADGDPVDGTPGENKVSVVEIYVFGNDGATLDTETTNADGYVKLTSTDLGTPANWPYTTQVQMGADNNKDVIVVANANLGTPAAIAASLTPVKTAATLNFDDVMGVIAAAEMSNTVSRQIPTAGFIMSGYTLQAAVVAERSDNVISVKIDRAVARIEHPNVATTVLFDLEQKKLNDIFGFTDAPTNTIPRVTTDDNLEFTFGGYAVINGFKKTSAGFVGNNINDGAAGTPADVIYSIGYKPYSDTPGAVDGTHYYTWGLWNEKKTTSAGPTVGSGIWDDYRGGRIETNSNMLMGGATPNVTPSAWTGAYSGTGTISGSNTGNWFITKNDDFDKVYVYESKPALKSDESYAGYDPDGVIALILKGDIKDVPSGNTQTRYWRVNIRVQDAYHIIRNSTYQTAINKIVSAGYKSPQEAEESEEIVAKPGDTVAEFEITINPWTLKTVGTGDI